MLLKNITCLRGVSNIKLNLFWKDKNEEIYNLGVLYKENEIYKFDVFEETLKKAVKNGCYGIGNFTFLTTHYESHFLFDFFANRLPDKEDEDCKKIMQLYNLDSYDDMELLKSTRGILFTDNYWVEEV